MQTHCKHPSGSTAVRVVIAVLLAAVSTTLAMADLGNTGFFPSTALYEPYLADLRLSAESMIGVAFVPTKDVVDSGSPRYNLKLGGSYGIYRRKGADFDWQIDLQATFASVQFDWDADGDNIGWDGLLGVVGTFALDERKGFRVGLQHDSSHIGDELAERTGAEMIDYTREEFFVGFNEFAKERWRLYGEVGYGYHQTAAGQEQWRFQGGAEYKAPGTAYAGLGGWYGAVNVATYQEKDYQLDLTVEGGVFFPSDSAQWRLAVTLYKGTVPMGQFFQDDETYIILGIHLNP